MGENAFAVRENRADFCHRRSFYIAIFNSILMQGANGWMQTMDAMWMKNSQNTSVRQGWSKEKQHTNGIVLSAMITKRKDLVDDRNTPHPCCKYHAISFQATCSDWFRALSKK